MYKDSKGHAPAHITTQETQTMPERLATRTLDVGEEAREELQALQQYIR